MHIYLFRHTYTYINTDTCIYIYICKHIHIDTHTYIEQSLCVMFKVLEYCQEVRERKIQSYYRVYFRINTFRKGMNPLIPPAMGSKLLMLFF